MTQGDNLIGIKTTYKGIEMRSKLETKVAMFLDALKIKWEYEPRTFLLSNGIPYRPDFYLTELKMWLEVKGNIQQHNKEISKRFVEENKTELLMISANRMIWFSSKDFDDGVNIDGDVQLSFCSHCSKFFFSSSLGSWHCRNCNTHEGDHDIVGEFLYDENYFLGKNGEGDKIDFSDISDIKRWLDARKISV